MSTLVIILLTSLIIFWRPPFRLGWKRFIPLIIVLVVGLVWLNGHIRATPEPDGCSRCASEDQELLLNNRDF